MGLEPTAVRNSFTNPGVLLFYSSICYINKIGKSWDLNPLQSCWGSIFPYQGVLNYSTRPYLLYSFNISDISLYFKWKFYCIYFLYFPSSSINVL